MSARPRPRRPETRTPSRTAPPPQRPRPREPRPPGEHHFGRPHVRPVAIRIALTAGLSGLIVLVLGGKEAYWLAVPAVLVAGTWCRTRRGTAGATLAVLVAAGAPSALVHGSHTLPAIPLALLVPTASATVMLAVRERLEGEREAMRRSALTDPLTGVANRRSLLSRIEYEIARHHRARRPFGVVMLDLDGFKQLNDRFGHAAGDDLLREVAAAIARAVRDQDTVARMGGDEFCVLAPETDLAGTQQLAGRVLSAVSGVTTGIEALGASAGVSVFPSDGRGTTALLEAADQGLLESKRRRGRTRARRAA